MAAQTTEDSKAQDLEIDDVRVRILPDGRLDRRNAARYLGLSPRTLSQWAWKGKGPRCVHVGGKIFYFQGELDSFVRGEGPEFHRDSA